MGHQLGRMAQTPPNGQDVPNREVVVDFTPSHYRSFLEDFIECDTNKDGFLQSSEIKMMLTKQLKRAPSAVETAAVMRKLDVSLSGQVSFADYLTALCGGGSYRVLAEDIPVDIEQLFKAVAAQIQVYAIEPVQIRKLFERIDDKGTGLISRDQCHYCLQVAGIFLDNYELGLLCSHGEEQETVTHWTTERCWDVCTAQHADYVSITMMVPLTDRRPLQLGYIQAQYSGIHTGC